MYLWLQGGTTENLSIQLFWKVNGYSHFTEMKKFVLLFIFINLYVAAYNQVIKGTIFDSKTKDPISFGAVYFNGTCVGASSDLNGYFELDISKYITMPLTISALGYYSVTLAEFQADKAIIVYLTPKIFELKEVVINAKSLASERRRNLNIFKHEFLGLTKNALYCKITNESDITFNYGSNDDTLKAFALRPILIDNRGLGYQITYYLDEFKFCKKNTSVFFKGNIIFKEDSTTSKMQKQRFEQRRKYVYLGSRMQFFRELWANNLKSTGFFALDSTFSILKYNKIVIQTDSLDKYLKKIGYLGIAYSARFPTSHIVFLKDRVYFDKNGYFDPAGISWEGEMSKQRIADWLPYDYTVK
jgi:hypothetical protein